MLKIYRFIYFRIKKNYNLRVTFIFSNKSKLQQTLIRCILFKINPNQQVTYFLSSNEVSDDSNLKEIFHIVSYSSMSKKERFNNFIYYSKA